MNATTRDERSERASATAHPETIERDIDATRSEVRETLDALQARFSPGQILDQALGFVRENGGEFGRNLGNSVKQNPLPVILTGVGLLWMIASRGSAPGGSAGGSARVRTDSDRTEVEDISREGEGVGERLSDAASSARERISGLAGRVSDRAGAAAERVQGAAHAAGAQAQRAREGFGQLFEEQPLLIGALGVALGALFGAALPASETEDRMFGQARDRALQRSKEVAAEGYAKAREFAADVAEDGPISH